MRTFRRVLGAASAAFVLSVGAVATTVPAGAGSFTDTTITVTKVVDGTGTGPFTVVIADCDNFDEPIEATLGFDATGAPTTTDNDLWVADGGQWVLPDARYINVPQVCTATETDADGATSTSWTCAYSVEQSTEPPPGCAADAGSGTGPVEFTLIGAGEGAAGQDVDLVFTNTIAPVPAPITAEVTFTG